MKGGPGKGKPPWNILNKSQFWGSPEKDRLDLSTDENETSNIRGRGKRQKPKKKKKKKKKKPPAGLKALS